MKSVLDPLAAVPGVRAALLSTLDGVPIVWSGVAEEAEVGALAALAAGWAAEVARTVAPISWGLPSRLVLRASRGALVIVGAPGALLLAMLEGGTSPEDVRLPMEAALARLERSQRAPRGRNRQEREREQERAPGIFPAPASAPVDGAGNARESTAGAEQPSR